LGQTDAVRRLAPVVLAASAGLLLLTGWAPGPAGVSIGDNFFTPATVSVGRGATVQWTNGGRRTHTTTANAPLDLWNARLSPGQKFPQTFVAAGTYRYHCTIHFGMSGTVKVPIAASPAIASIATTFTVTVATTNAPAGFAYLVQKKDPGGSFKVYKTITTPTTTFKTMIPGTYQFRAALKRNGSTAASEFSDPKSVTAR
jgi:plastocyanin